MAAQIETVRGALEEYRAEIERFFALMPEAEIARSLPVGKTGVLIPTIWAEIGDAPNRWASFRHLQAQAGSVPVTKRSGKSKLVQFRYACNKRLRHALDLFAFTSLRRSTWASAYYKQQRARGKRHHEALRALAAKWLKIIFVIWSRHVSYIEDYHIATINRQTMSQQIPFSAT